MTTGCSLVKICCANYRQSLSERLWNSHLCEDGVDFDLAWGGRCRTIRAHRFVLKLFLSPDNPKDAGASFDCGLLVRLLQFIYTDRLVFAIVQLESLLALATQFNFAILVDLLRKEQLANSIPNNIEREYQLGIEADNFKNTGREVVNSSRIRKNFEIRDCYVARERLSNSLLANKKSEKSVSAVVEKICQQMWVIKMDLNAKSYPPLELAHHYGENSLLTNKNNPIPSNELQPYSFCYQSAVSTGIQMTSERSYRSAEMFCNNASKCHPQTVPCYLVGPNPETFYDSREESSSHQQLEINARAGQGTSERKNLDATQQQQQQQPGKKKRQTKTKNKLHNKSLDDLATTIPSAAFQREGPTDKRPFVCAVCLKAFATIGALKSHGLIHSDKKKYECYVCEKKFTQEGNMKTHIRIHTGEKPFKCDVCSKEFRQVIHLENHRRIHTGQIPFKCHVCAKSFNQAGNLLTHISKRHPGESPYKCDLCSETFSAKFDLNIHKEQHHPSKDAQNAD